MHNNVLVETNLSYVKSDIHQHKPLGFYPQLLFISLHPVMLVKTVTQTESGQNRQIEGVCFAERGPARSLGQVMGS